MMIIYSGKGWKPEAIIWGKGKAEQTEGFYVLSHDGLIDWAFREFH